MGKEFRVQTSCSFTVSWYRPIITHFQTSPVCVQTNIRQFTLTHWWLIVLFQLFFVKVWMSKICTKYEQKTSQVTKMYLCPLQLILYTSKNLLFHVQLSLCPVKVKVTHERTVFLTVLQIIENPRTWVGVPFLQTRCVHAQRKELFPHLSHFSCCGLPLKMQTNKQTTSTSYKMLNVLKILKSITSITSNECMYVPSGVLRQTHIRSNQ